MYLTQIFSKRGHVLTEQVTDSMLKALDFATQHATYWVGEGDFSKVTIQPIDEVEDGIGWTKVINRHTGAFICR